MDGASRETRWKVVCWDSAGAGDSADDDDDIDDVHFNTQPKDEKEIGGEGRGGGVGTQVEEEDSMSDVVFTSASRGEVERYSQTQSGELSQAAWSGERRQQLRRVLPRPASFSSTPGCREHTCVGGSNRR